jgi:hypothetical protein
LLFLTFFGFLSDEKSEPYLYLKKSFVFYFEVVTSLNSPFPLCQFMTELKINTELKQIFSFNYYFPDMSENKTFIQIKKAKSQDIHDRTFYA